jgi:hypothetical protein
MNAVWRRDKEKVNSRGVLKDVFTIKAEKFNANLTC